MNVDWRDWLPYRIDVGPEVPVVQWCRTGGRRLTEPFFEQDLHHHMTRPFNRAFDLRSPLEDVAAALDDGSVLTPTAFIFHLGRCGSTLVARMLAADPANRVLSEPGPFDSVLRAPLRRPIDEPTYLRWLRSALGCMSRPAPGEHRLFVKLDCWAVMAADHLARAFPDVPWLVVYRDPVEVLVSMLEQKPLTLLPLMVPSELFGIPLSDALAMPDEVYGARVLGCLLEQFGRIAPRSHLIAYPDLPGALWPWLDELGIEPPDDVRRAMQAVTARHAKTPDLTFRPDAAAKQAAATPDLRAAVADSAAAAFAQLEEVRGRRDQPPEPPPVGALC